MDQFWSPATNRRDDVFGGSLDNRLRFTFRVLDAIRGRIGPDFIVGIRMVADEDWDQGLSRAEGVEIARRLVASGQIDFLNLIRGHIDTDAALAKVIPIQGMPAAPHRSEEHPSELQSLMRISYAVFCLKKKNKTTRTHLK